MRVKIHRELCSGVSNCVAIAPTVFKLIDQNKAVVLDPSSVNKETLMAAAKNCPESAVILEDDEGNRLYL